MKYCSFCYNAHVWAQESRREEDFSEVGLDDSNDFHSAGIGDSASQYQIYMNSGNGKPCTIEFCALGPDKTWHTVAQYYPKFCPECGRELAEYIIGDRGRLFKKKET